MFGTGDDIGNLRDSLDACSFGQTNVIAGLTGTVAGNDPNEVAIGVVEVTIGISIETNNRGTIRNAVNTAAQAKLGISFPGPYTHILHSLKGCYLSGDCGWAAYAYVNSWNSVYQSNYYKSPGVLVHEVSIEYNIYISYSLFIYIYEE